jgi:hypothetical protein
MTESPLHEAADYAFARLKDEGGDVIRLPITLQTVEEQSGADSDQFPVAINYGAACARIH